MFVDDHLSLTRELETPCPGLTWRLQVWRCKEPPPCLQDLQPQPQDIQAQVEGILAGFPRLRKSEQTDESSEPPQTDGPSYNWRLTRKFEGTDLGWLFGRSVSGIIQELRNAVKQVQAWPDGNVPGTLSRKIRGWGKSEHVTAHARGADRWITWTLDYQGLNLSPAMVLRLADDLERVPAVVEEMIDFLESMEQN